MSKTHSLWYVSCWGEGVRELGGERERGRETESERESERDGEKEIEKVRETERDRETEREIEERGEESTGMFPGKGRYGQTKQTSHPDMISGCIFILKAECPPPSISPSLYSSDPPSLPPPPPPPPLSLFSSFPSLPFPASPIKLQRQVSIICLSVCVCV